MHKRDLYKLIAKYIEDQGFEIYRVDESIKIKFKRGGHPGSFFDFNIGFYNNDINVVTIHEWVRSWHEVATISLSDPRCFDKILEILNGN